ncbi:transposable element Tcb2 transposase [Trichonephila clavipes]|nr:transposable element Tcb2 transposase [Trichonephila clavipes]
MNHSALMEVSEELGIAQSVISKLWQRFQYEMEISRRSAASNVSRQLSAASSTEVSKQTVNRRLRHSGLYARRLLRCVPLTVAHCLQCLA